MKKVHSKLNRQIAIAALLLFTIIFANCNKNDKHNEGFTLKEVKIDNARIDSVAKDFIDRQLSYNYDSVNNALLMDILIYPKIQSDNATCTQNQKRKVIVYDNNTLFITFSKQKKNLISAHHIFSPSYKKIVGFYIYKNTDIIILTNINDMQIFKHLLNNTFSYTKRQKVFEFIKYPQKQAEEILYNPLFLCYKMVDGYMTDSILTTNIVSSWNTYSTCVDTCSAGNDANI